MSELQKLETLLSRVQQRRSEPRKATPSAAASTSAVGQVRSMPTERAAVVEERVSLPGARSAAASPPRQPAAPAAPRRPAGGRLSTPLEMALEDELSRPPVAAASHAASPPKTREPSMPAAPTGPSFDASEEPFTIEPEPVREPARPIAQTMSKHSMELDVTFGAMLKRSLSLRPR